jgi:hypothetical protein
MTDAVGWGAIVVAALSLGTAVVTNLDDVKKTFCSLTPQVCATQPDLDGKWLGVFTERRPPTDPAYAKDPYVVRSESVELKSKGKEISGGITTTVGRRRFHAINSGSFAFSENDPRKDGYLGFITVGNDPDRGLGGVAYMLKGSLSSGPVIGYWTGWDPDEKKMMTCPYVLSREPDPEKVASQEAAWLKRDCYAQ